MEDSRDGERAEQNARGSLKELELCAARAGADAVYSRVQARKARSERLHERGASQRWTLVAALQSEAGAGASDRSRRSRTMWCSRAARGDSARIDAAPARPPAVHHAHRAVHLRVRRSSAGLCIAVASRWWDGR